MGIIPPLGALLLSRAVSVDRALASMFCDENIFPIETGCNQEEGPKKGFVMGSRTQGVQEILENIYIGCPHPHQSEVGDGTHGARSLRAVLNSNSFADNL